ncbi:hypothetical protein MYX76_10530 [Desulfobacterota bacterium AH_259_B03_O07]|nr:hypothetical protein [Desulfobacterota bacterium AH_259_B03_O07]
MNELNYIKPQKISLKNHPNYDEKWMQEKIAEDPSILGLGDVILKDKERIQPHAGRLDLLLQTSDSNGRYEVEIQLGKTDESHIIRTIEYWDIERKRYPQYDHTAVIVAEDITSRFLNVISLFNGFIPLIAIQMNAFRIENNISLVCTTVLDRMTLGVIDEEDEEEIADRNYWERRGTKSTVAMADEILALIQNFAPELELKYNKFYIGLAKDGQPNNFAIFRPQKNGLRLEVRLKKSDEIENKLNEAGLDLMDYDTKWGRYRIRLTKQDVKKNEESLKILLKDSWADSTSS